MTEANAQLTMCAQCGAWRSPSYVHEGRCGNCHIGDRLREDARLPPWSDEVKYKHAPPPPEVVQARIAQDFEALDRIRLMATLALESDPAQRRVVLANIRDEAAQALRKPAPPEATP